MNAKTNYAVVGAFVLLSIGLIVVFVVWMLQPKKNEAYQTYRIEFGESVSGLNVDSPVKFRGVAVGKVGSIRISPANIEQIEVIINILKSTPVKIDTEAKLKPQGITGLTFVDLSPGSRDTPLLRPSRPLEVPTIASKPSFFVTVERSFGTASENLSETLIRLRELLGDANRDAVSRLLVSLAAIAEKTDRALNEERIGHFDSMVQNMASLSKRMEQSLPALETLINSSDDLAKQATVSVASLQRSFETMAETMRVINVRNKNGDYSVKETMGPGMKQIEETMRQMEQSLIIFNQIMMRYRNDPSGMILEYQLKNKGPGEVQ